MNVLKSGFVLYNIAVYLDVAMHCLELLRELDNNSSYLISTN